MKLSSIEWTGVTWNPWHGCRKVSAGCKYCYMYRDKERYGLDPTKVVRASPKTFNAPMNLKTLEVPMVFTCSWSDWFIEEADAWRDEAWEIIRKTPHLTYQILTKRPERILSHLPSDWGDGYPNVWLGISAEDQKMFDLRVPLLLKVPASVRWVSAEPLVGSISSPLISDIDWMVLGGESGNETGKYKYRWSSLEWYQSLIRECAVFDVPVFMKQTGTYLANFHKLGTRHGRDMSEWPDEWGISVRQYPSGYEF